MLQAMGWQRVGHDLVTKQQKNKRLEPALVPKFIAHFLPLSFSRCLSAMIFNNLFAHSVALTKMLQQ